MAQMMVRITAPHFCAGAVLKGDWTTFGSSYDYFASWPYAPILRYIDGWELGRIIRYCKEQNWTVEVLP